MSFFVLSKCLFLASANCVSKRQGSMRQTFPLVQQRWEAARGHLWTRSLENEKRFFQTHLEMDDRLDKMLFGLWGCVIWCLEIATAAASWMKILVAAILSTGERDGMSAADAYSEKQCAKVSDLHMCGGIRGGSVLIGGMGAMAQ